jgi:glycosyltransferase involved in cell wall biosynthesis
MWEEKKRLFGAIPRLAVVGVSDWITNEAKRSFLGNAKIVKTIHNGIDLTVFKPTDGNVHERYGISKSKKVILGVSAGWSITKGLDVFVELAKRLNNEEYQIVLVGTDSETDKGLPSNIVSIHRTENQKELAELYTAADLFVNPTRQDTYPTVNMEAIACGTPVVTFETGGSPEILDELTGSVVPCDDIDALEKEIVRICTEKPYKLNKSVEKALDFDKNSCFKEYLSLYENS